MGRVSPYEAEKKRVPDRNIKRRPSGRVRPWHLALGVLGLYAGVSATVAGISALRAGGVADVWVAGIVYAIGMPAIILLPSRGSRGYNPFGPVMRRAAPRL